MEPQTLSPPCMTKSRSSHIMERTQGNKTGNPGTGSSEQHAMEGTSDRSAPGPSGRSGRDPNLGIGDRRIVYPLAQMEDVGRSNESLGPRSKKIDASRSEKTMQPCRKANNCSRPGCKFAHPTRNCKYRPCLKANCTYRHVDGHERGGGSDLATGIGNLSASAGRSQISSRTAQESTIPLEPSSGFKATLVTGERNGIDHEAQMATALQLRAEQTSGNNKYKGGRGHARQTSKSTMNQTIQHPRNTQQSSDTPETPRKNSGNKFGRERFSKGSKPSTRRRTNGSSVPTHSARTPSRAPRGSSHRGRGQYHGSGGRNAGRGTERTGSPAPGHSTRHTPDYKRQSSRPNRQTVPQFRTENMHAIQSHSTIDGLAATTSEEADVASMRQTSEASADLLIHFDEAFLGVDSIANPAKDHNNIILPTSFDATSRITILDTENEEIGNTDYQQGSKVISREAEENKQERQFKVDIDGIIPVEFIQAYKWISGKSRVAEEPESHLNLDNLCSFHDLKSRVRHGIASYILQRKHDPENAGQDSSMLSAENEILATGRMTGSEEDRQHFELNKWMSKVFEEFNKLSLDEQVEVVMHLFRRNMSNEDAPTNAASMKLENKGEVKNAAMKTD